MSISYFGKPTFPKELTGMEFSTTRVIGTAHRESLKTFTFCNEVDLKQFVAESKVQ